MPQLFRTSRILRDSPLAYQVKPNKSCAKRGSGHSLVAIRMRIVWPRETAPALAVMERNSHALIGNGRDNGLACRGRDDSACAACAEDDAGALGVGGTHASWRDGGRA